ncbi:isochorismatase family protein [Cysteiniphilum sp. QT6929]|uniref:isochorismatase family protein n=1 Tax=Cysteiniphilum sp. QT6929 TaxID=2975055 RepID=UPI0024B36685|nr:isochorismatase family protein [Cysteiniphilum sp. QT6929]WHN66587.1 isochorismatase family protein [Cysteiniphilum sp. QT6929]
MHYDVSLDQIADINTQRKALNKQHAALVIIEMQNVFHGEIISDKQINHVKQLIAFADQNHIKKIFVRHNDSSQTSENMIQWWGGDQIVKDSQAWQIIDEFDLTGAEIVDKSQYSAFYQTNLDKILQDHQIKDVIICGVMTNCCCETTTRDAFMRGYNAFFVSDATATVNADLHLAAIKNIAFGFAQVIDTKCLISS